MSISDYYKQTITVKTFTTSTEWNSEGSWSTGTAVVAAVNPHEGAEVYSGDKISAVADHKIYCDASVAVTPKSRITWSSSTFDVLSIKQTLFKGHHKTILVREHR